MNRTFIFFIIITFNILTPLYAYRSRKKPPPNTEFVKAAACNDLLHIRKLIMQKKVNVNIQDEEGQCALHVTSSPDIVFELMISGADPNLVTKNDLTPLLSALVNGHRDKAIVLLLCGANPNTLYKKKTPLMFAIKQGDYQLVKELVKSGAKIYPQSIEFAKNHNQTIASFLDHYRSAKNNNGVSNTLDKDGLSSIHRAILRNDPIEFDALICAGGKLNIQTTRGKTPLHLAVEYNLQTMTQKLLELQAKVGIQDKNGQTPLHYAAQKGNRKIVTLLQNHGASRSIIDAQGHIPLAIAQKHQHQNIITLLSTTHAKPKKKQA